MKRRRLHIELTEEQELILALLVVILLAISMLYCLGFASLALRQTWENMPLPWSETSSPQPEIEATPTPLPAETTPPPQAKLPGIGGQNPQSILDRSWLHRYNRLVDVNHCQEKRRFLWTLSPC